MSEGLTEADYKAMYPGFTIACDRCGRREVRLESTLGYSPESGGWGAVSLMCDGCGQTAELLEG